MRDPQEQTIAFSVVDSIPGKNPQPEVERTGILVDVSEAGVGFLTDVALEPGDLVQFKNPLLAHSGIVMWTLKTEDKLRAGVRFV